MENSPLSTGMAEIYKKHYFDQLASLSESDRNIVLQAVNSNTEPGPIVVSFIKRVISNAEKSDEQVKNGTNGG